MARRVESEEETGTLQDIVRIFPVLELKPLEGEILKELKIRDAFKEILPIVGESIEGKENEFVVCGHQLLKAMVATDQKIETYRKQLFMETGTLPENLQSTLDITVNGNSAVVRVSRDDALSIMAKSETTTIEHLREVADALGFVIIPFEYLQNNYMKLDGYDKVITFMDFIGDELDLYVLAPITALDVCKQTKSKRASNVYFGGADLSSAIMPVAMAIDMIVPSLREMWSAIREIAEKTEGIEKKVSSAEQRASAFSSKLNIAEARFAEERARVSGLPAKVFRARDPMMFAVPYGIDIRTETSRAVLGPCWGERVDLKVFKACNLDASGSTND